MSRRATIWRGGKRPSRLPAMSHGAIERLAAQLTADLRAGTITPEGLALVSLVSAEGHRRQAEHRAGRVA